MTARQFFAPLGVLVCLLAAGCGSTAPIASSQAPASAAAASSAATGSAAANALYEAAKKEGEVVVNNQDPDRDKLAVDTFTKRYPGIKVTWQVGRGADISSKLITQAQANMYTHDVYASGPHDADAMRQAGMFAPYQSPELSAVRPDFLDPNKTLMPLYVLVYGLTVNTNQVPAGQEPKSYKDLLDPKWKGKIAMQDPRGSGGTMTALIGISKESSLGMDYLQKLAGQDMFIGRETLQLMTDLIRGEHAAMLGASAGNLVAERDKNPSAPFKQIKPTEGMVFTLNWMGLVKNAPHPNAAKLWIDWRLSQEGQEILAKEGLAPVRSGVKVERDEINTDGVKILYLDTGQDADRLPEYTKLWDTTFFKK